MAEPTPTTEEKICPNCRGHGVFESGLVCNRCGGTGIIKRIVEPPSAGAQERLELADELRRFFAKVAVFPEDRPDGFMDLLELRNKAPQAEAALRSADAEIARLNKDCDASAKMANDLSARSRKAEAALAEMQRIVGRCKDELYLGCRLGMDNCDGSHGGKGNWLCCDMRTVLRRLASPSPNPSQEEPHG